MNYPVWRSVGKASRLPHIVASETLALRLLVLLLRRPAHDPNAEAIVGPLGAQHIVARTGLHVLRLIVEVERAAAQADLVAAARVVVLPHVAALVEGAVRA